MIFGIRQGYHDFAGRFRVIQVMVVTVENQGLRARGRNNSTQTEA
jgi:hypothetical protein